jgi:N-acyl-D-amino-acid deacylase
MLLVGATTLPEEMWAEETYDVIIRGGTIYDGSGGQPYVADLAIAKDTITQIGQLGGARAHREIAAHGMAVAPGFINMLSWATASLLVDGRGQSDIRQGVTLELFGEGWSYGPLNDAMRRELKEQQGDLRFDIPWMSLAEYLDHTAQRGVSPNVASLVGATTVRIHVLGYADRKPTGEELDRMRTLVRQEMENGALGVGSSLIYTPAFYADTRELVALCKVAAQYDGIYTSHVRSEGNRLLEAVDELIEIARQAEIPAEIYHLKAAGKKNWNKLDPLISKVEAARAEGLGVTADMYPYEAGATGLNAMMPPWVQEGGYEQWRDRLRDPAIRRRVRREMRTETDQWENLLLLSGSPDNVLLVGFKNPDLKHLTGKTLAEVSRRRGKSPEETAMELVIEDGSRVDCIYFMMSQENIKKGIALPWVSFGSDAAALAPENSFLKSSTHPRAYGCFARLLGHYVRDQNVIPLEAAIHKLTGLPASNLGLRRRGFLKPGYYADVVVFDPATVQDRATYEEPHQYAVGVQHVFVNGTQVLKDGEHTGAKPGRVVRGSGRFRKASYRQPVELTETGRAIHQSGFVFDGHNDLAWQIRNKGSSSFEKVDIAKLQAELHTDIPRLRQGNVGAQFWSVYVPAETRIRGEALLQTLEQIELVHAMVDRYSEVFEIAQNSDDIERIQRSGKIASLIGVEGGHSIENSLENLRRLYKLGARYMTLTHADTLDWADSATDEARHDGLSPFGEEVVREMNRLGMLVDLSHVSDQTMKDALRISRAPVIFSHSSSRAIAPHPRNVPDDVLRLVARNGGVVMVNFFSGFVHPESARGVANIFDVYRELRKKFPSEDDFQQARRRWFATIPIQPGTIHHVVDHIDHIVRVAGIEHVGLGSDFDGVEMLPAQLEDVSKYPYITQELVNRDYTKEEIHMLMSGNTLRVLRQAEKVAAELTENGD